MQTPHRKAPSIDPGPSCRLANHCTTMTPCIKQFVSYYIKVICYNSYHFIHILIGSFQIHYSGVQRQTAKSCITVQILMDSPVFGYYNTKWYNTLWYDRIRYDSILTPTWDQHCSESGVSRPLIHGWWGCTEEQYMHTYIHIHTYIHVSLKIRLTFFYTPVN